METNWKITAINESGVEETIFYTDSRDTADFIAECFADKGCTKINVEKIAN